MTAPKHDAHEDTSKRIFCFGFVLLVLWEYLTVHGKCLNGKGNGTFFCLESILSLFYGVWKISWIKLKFKKNILRLNKLNKLEINLGK